MPFQPADLSALTYANGFTLWHYRSSDSMNDIDGAGYFSAASNMVRSGDLIVVNAGVGIAPTSGLLVVLSNSGGSVDTSNSVALGAVNSD